MDARVRLLPQRDYYQLKAAFREAVQRAGGASRVCGISRCSPSHLSEFMSANRIDRFPPLDVAADIESDIGSPIIARALADLAGFMLVERHVETTTRDYLRRLSDIARESGEVLEELASSLADGNITTEEAIHIIAEASELVDHVNALKAAVEERLQQRTMIT